MGERKNTRLSLKPIDALLGTDDADKAVDVELARLHGFKNHPFRVVDDEDMYRLAESISRFHGNRFYIRICPNLL